MTSTALAVVLILVSIVGLILNIYILVVVLLTRQVSSANNLLLLHLGAVDTLLGILFLSFSAPGLTKDNWFFIGAPCAFHGFLFTLLHPLLLWTVCGLNCDRYYAIASPLHYGHLVNPKKILVGLGAGWTVSIALCVPPLFTVAPYKYIHGLGACAPDFSGRGALWYAAIYTGLTLLLPATLIVCCNMKILMIARYHRHRIASAIYEVTLSAQVTITHQRNPFFVPTVTAPSAGGPKFRGRSALYSVFQLLGSFMLLYLPYYIVIMWQSSASVFSSENPVENENPPQYGVHPHFLSAVFALLTCSPSINGFLYGVKSKTVRKTFQNYWRKKLTKSEVNQEIQARTPSTCGSRRQSLTPLGFLAKPMIQRRMSDALLDVQKATGSPQRPRMKRIASELTWTQDSTASLNISPIIQKRILQTASCNTLQVPRIEDEQLAVIVNENKQVHLKHNQSEEKLQSTVSGKPSISATNLLQKFFGCEDQTPKKPEVQSAPEDIPKRSPRILITRAFSEESDKNYSNPETPAKEMHKTHSATNLLEKKWRQMLYKEGNIDAEEEAKHRATRPLLQNSNKSDSSETSEESSHQCLLKEKISNHAEDHLLISWPSNSTAKRNGKMEKFPQSQEVVL